MRKTMTTLLASTAIVAFASSAYAMGGCSYGHTKQVMASTADQEEDATMSTFDGAVTLPEDDTQADRAAAVTETSDDDESLVE